MKINKSLKVDAIVAAKIDKISNFLGVTPHSYMNSSIEDCVDSDFKKYGLATPYFLANEVCKSSGWYGEFFLYIEGKQLEASFAPISWELNQELARKDLDFQSNLSESGKKNVQRLDEQMEKINPRGRLIKEFDGNVIYVRENDKFPKLKEGRVYEKIEELNDTLPPIS